MNKYQIKLCDILDFGNAFYFGKYIGRAAYIKIGKSMKVKAELVRVKFTKRLEGVKITVLNNNCVVDSVTFCFEDYCELHERYDGTKVYPYIYIDKDDIHWEARPHVDEHKKLARAIDDYVSLFSRRIRASVRYMRMFE